MVSHRDYEDSLPSDDVDQGEGKAVVNDKATEAASVRTPNVRLLEKQFKAALNFQRESRTDAGDFGVVSIDGDQEFLARLRVEPVLRHLPRVRASCITARPAYVWTLPDSISSRRRSDSVIQAASAKKSAGASTFSIRNLRSCR